MSMAKVMIIGNLGRDPETRYTPNGKMNVRFTLATNTKWTDQSGQLQERATWFNVTAWGRSAETLDTFSQQGVIRKGTNLFVLGRLESRDYLDQNGQNRTSLDVTVDEFQLLGSRAESEDQMGGGTRREPAGDQPGGDSGPQDSQELDDIPF